MLAAKNILRYLKGTLNYGLLFPATNEGKFNAYADADFGRDFDTRRSTGGIMYKIGTAPIAASSKLQPTVSRSTAEAEYRVT
jgi:hypothetical protein